MTIDAYGWELERQIYEVTWLVEDNYPASVLVDTNCPELAVKAVWEWLYPVQRPESPEKMQAIPKKMLIR